jgi:hypothetical protein
LEDQIEMMDAVFHNTLEFLKGLRDKAKDKLKLEEVIKLAEEGRTDIILNAKELIGTGIATHIVKSVEDIHEDI